MDDQLHTIGELKQALAGRDHEVQSLQLDWQREQQSLQLQLEQEQAESQDLQVTGHVHVMRDYITP